MVKYSKYYRVRGFALPSVLIASIIMLTVLVAAVTSSAAIRVSLASQYYNQLSQAASDAGVAYARSCLDANNGTPTWTDISPLKPNTDCNGTQLYGFDCPVDSVDTRCAVAVNDNVRTSFSVGFPTLDNNKKAIVIRSVGTVNLLRNSDKTTWRSYNQNTSFTVSNRDIIKNDLEMNLDAGDPLSYGGSGAAWTDLSGNNNNATLYNNVAYSSSYGGALNFNAANKSGEILASTSSNLQSKAFSSMSVGAWIKVADGATQASDYAYIIHNSGDYAIGNSIYMLGLTTNGAAVWGWAGNYATTTTSTTYNDGKWHYLMGVWDGTNSMLYVDGVLNKSVATSVNKTGSSGTLSIGGTALYLGNRFYSGLLGVVQIYGRSLSVSEIQQNYDALKNRYFDRQVQSLVVGGGGSGGGGWQGGGGGAGGVIYTPNMPVTFKSYNITVGAGGAGGGTPSANRGGDSIFDTIVAKGGGYGGGEPMNGHLSPVDGGSGGGGTHGSLDGPLFIGQGIVGQGNNGGQGVSDGTAPGYYIGGGGGGAGVVGQNAPYSGGGNGGNGLAFTISGASIYYGGGGGGTARGGAGGYGGSGGGGNGGATGANGTANTGGGGGAGNGSMGTGKSGAGGSGVVIISYPTGSLTATGGTITTSNGRTIHKFTSSGVFTVSA